MKNIRSLIKNKRLIFDGAMGSLLQANGLMPGELPERWNITHSDVIVDIHRQYLKAGAEIITTNTFGLNNLKYSRSEMDKIAKAAIDNARKAGAKIVAYDIGPSGRMIKPWGDFAFEDAVKLFKEQALLAKKYGADLVLIETMADSYETKAALLAVKENTDLPVFVTNAYSLDGKLLTGASPKAMVSMLEGLGADVIGANCSMGPKQLYAIAKELCKYASVPVMIQPNAGLPVIRNNKTVYDVGKEQFAKTVASMVDLGVSIFGGCCGTTPEYIKLMSDKLKDKPLNISREKEDTIVSSYAKAVQIYNDLPIIVGERINPSGNKNLKAAIIEQDFDYVIKLGLEQENNKADILDVNMGVPNTDEVSNLSRMVFEMQSASSLPLSIDTSNTKALEKAVRLYNGKPLINSVNGSKESLKKVLPIVSKYGGTLVCLPLDEKGVPEKAKDRIKICKQIIKEASKYGIKKKDLIFDGLTLPVSASKTSALETLKTIELIKNELGCKSVLGVSNVSFGLPNRAKLNASFFYEALTKGLNVGIVNPMSKELMSFYQSYIALHGLDEGFSKYIEYMDGIDNKEANTNKSVEDVDLKTAIIKGLKHQASILTKQQLKDKSGLDIVDTEIIPALDIVGKAYEEGKMYLPQLLLAAEASQASFEEIKAYTNLNPDKSKIIKKEKFVLATVKGDIHDLGKNIVKLLLENYGFDVIDLGKDVPKETIVKTIKDSGAKLCGLSALMTTTVPAMEESIKLIREKCPDCKVIVGGAVLTKEVADRIGADFYGKDAMATVRYAKENSK